MERHVKMERHIKSRPDGTYQQIVRPGTLRFLDFARLRLNEGGKHAGNTAARECVLDIFSGTASVSVERSEPARSEAKRNADPAQGSAARQTTTRRDAAAKGQQFARVGSRTDVFSGPPVML